MAKKAVAVKQDYLISATGENERDLKRKQWQRWENVGLKPDFSVDDIVLNWVDARTTDLNVTGAVTSLDIAMSIEEAPTVTVSLVDPDGKLFSTRARRWIAPLETNQLRKRFPPIDAGWNPIAIPDKRGQALDLTLDGVTFRLVKAGWTQSSAEWELTFEHRLVYWLRRRTGAKRANRNSVTRAEFILGLLREVRIGRGHYRFVCPDLHKPQPIDGGKGVTGSAAGGAGGPLRVLHVGDSLTVGTLPYEKAELGSGKVAGYGKVGRNSDDSLTVFKAQLKSSHTVGVFDAGTNDDPSDVSGLQHNLEQAKQALGNRPLVIATLNRGTGNVGPMNTMIKDFAQSTSGVKLVDWGQEGDKYLTDGTHPSPAGYKKRADLFADAIRSAGGSSTARTAGPPRLRAVAAGARAAGGNRGGAAAKTEGTETEGGFSPKDRITVKHVAATPGQRRAIHAMLTEATRLGASNMVKAACIMAATQESGILPLTHGDAARNDTIGYFQQGPEWIAPKNTANPTLSTRAFLLGSDAHVGGTGNTSGWKQTHDRQLQKYKKGTPSLTYAIGMIQRCRSDLYGEYAHWQSEAERTVRLWGGAGAEGVGYDSYNVNYKKQYQFARNKDENSWAAMGRLAEEVGWRRFIVGNSLYYMDERALFARRVRYGVRPDDPAVLDLTYDVDWGRPISEATMTVVLDRWGAPPGSLVQLHGFGPADGRWLITSINRDWFSPHAEVSLRQPIRPKLEPANETGTRQVKGKEGTPTGGATTADGVPLNVTRLLAEAIKISKKGYPYAWGGGHGTPGVPTYSHRGEGLGYDCSGYTGALLKAGGYGGSAPNPGSGSFGSLPGARSGPGKFFTVYYNAGHVYCVFEKAMGTRYTRADTSSMGGDTNGSGARVRTSTRSNAGFLSCHWNTRMG